MGVGFDVYIRPENRRLSSPWQVVGLHLNSSVYLHSISGALKTTRQNSPYIYTCTIVLRLVFFCSSIFETNLCFFPKRVSCAAQGHKLNLAKAFGRLQRKLYMDGLAVNQCMARGTQHRAPQHTIEHKHARLQQIPQQTKRHP